MTAAQFHSFPTSASRRGVPRLGKSTGLGSIVIWSALGLTLTALGLALGFGAEIAAALATG
jgi:hypothetical protein